MATAVTKAFPPSLSIQGAHQIRTPHSGNVMSRSSQGIRRVRSPGILLSDHCLAVSVFVALFNLKTMLIVAPARASERSSGSGSASLSGINLIVNFYTFTAYADNLRIFLIVCLFYFKHVYKEVGIFTNIVTK